MSITEDLIELFNQHAQNGNGYGPEAIIETFGGDIWEKVTKIDEEFIEEHRWYNLYLYVYHVEEEDRYVGVHAEVASTEYQEHDSGEAFEVRPTTKTITTYIKV